MKQFLCCDSYEAIPALRLAGECSCRGQVNAQVTARSHVTAPDRLPCWVGGDHHAFFLGLAGFVGQFNALRIAMRMRQTCCLTSHVDRVRHDVKVLMGQVPPNRTQQVTPLGQGRLSRFFLGVAGFVRQFNALRIARRMSQTCCLTLHVDQVQNAVKLMGQVPPNGTQQVTPLGWGGPW